MALRRQISTNTIRKTSNKHTHKNDPDGFDKMIVFNGLNQVLLGLHNII
jgi:hypothetical protein